MSHKFTSNAIYLFLSSQPIAPPNAMFDFVNRCIHEALPNL